MKIGPWKVLPSQNLIEREGASCKIEPRAMDLLVYLAGAGRVVSADEILREVWQGRVFDDGIVYKKINQLRKALGDDLKRPTFIETIPKRGYRLIAPVVAATATAATTGAASALSETVRSSAAADASPAAGRLRRQRMLASLVGAAALLAGGVGLVLFGGRAPPSAGVGLRFIPLPYEQDGSEVLFNTTVWKPDGKAIAFAVMDRNTFGPPRPYTLYLDTSSTVPLTPGDFAAGGLPRAWTPAGHIVIDTRSGSSVTSDSGGLLTVPAVGGTPERLFDVPPGTTNLLAVTSDGSTLAALRRDEDGVWGIWAGSVASGTLRRYEPAPFAPRGFVNVPSLAFSPDGRSLVLWWNPWDAAGVPMGEQAWLMSYPPDASHPPRMVLESMPTGLGTPNVSWLPDNRHLVVSTAERGMPARLYLADTETGRFRMLSDTPSTANQWAPVVSPDGSRLLFTEQYVDYDLVTLNVHTGAVSPLLATNRMEQMPAWNAAASNFVYVAQRDGEFGIWLHAEGAPDRPLVTSRDFPPGTTFALYGPQLSPDGNRLIYGRVEADGRGGATDSHLWVSSMAGGAPMEFPGRTPARQVPGSWSPDGEWYVYSEIQPNASASLIKARTSGQFQTEALTNISRPAPMLPVWSPDGAWILFDHGGLKLISADGATIRDLGMSDTLCTFALGEQLLYCIKEWMRTPSLVVSDFIGATRFVSAVGAEYRPMNYFGPSWRLSLTPDGEGVSYSVDSTHVRLLLVDGLADVALP